MTDHRTTPSLCPNCGDKLDAATNMPGENGGPEPGDPTICLNCGCILVFTDKTIPGRALRRAEPKDFVAWPTEIKMMLIKAVFARRRVVPARGLHPPEAKH